MLGSSFIWEGKKGNPGCIATSGRSHCSLQEAGYISPHIPVPHGLTGEAVHEGCKPQLIFCSRSCIRLYTSRNLPTCVSPSPAFHVPCRQMFESTIHQGGEPFCQAALVHSLCPHLGQRMQGPLSFSTRRYPSGEFTRQLSSCLQQGFLRGTQQRNREHGIKYTI